MTVKCAVKLASESYFYGIHRHDASNQATPHAILLTCHAALPEATAARLASAIPNKTGFISVLELRLRKDVQTKEIIFKGVRLKTATVQELTHRTQKIARRQRFFVLTRHMSMHVNSFHALAPNLFRGQDMDAACETPHLL